MPSRPAVIPVPIHSEFPNRFVYASFFPLGCITAYAKAFDGGALCEALDFHGVKSVSLSEALSFSDSFDTDLRAVFLLSSYKWNHTQNIAFARHVKARYPRSLLIMGGPHIPRSRLDVAAFLADHPYVDVLARGEGEVQTAKLLQRITQAPDVDRLQTVDFENVLGLSFRDANGACIQTPDQPREKDLSAFPSPYLTGEFDPWFNGAQAMYIETNRGCPYGCTFCDWGAATLSKVHQMSSERVYGEIEFAGQRGVNDLSFCDANLGILQRDVDIVRHVIATKERYGHPRTVSLSNAKVATPRLKEISKLLHRAGMVVSGQVAVQTTDPQTLEIIKRSNIKIEEYDKLIAYYHQEQIPISSDFMLGLPGQTLQTCKRDLQFFFDRLVIPRIYPTVIMPNAPIAAPDYRAKYDIQADEHGFVRSTFSFTKNDFAHMQDLCLSYAFFVKLGVARSLLYFMQVEHGVAALDFVEKWRELARRPTPPYERSARIIVQMVNRKIYELGPVFSLSWSHEQAAALFDDLRGFYAELLDLYANEFATCVAGSDVEAVIDAQLAVMPSKAQKNHRIPLRHDVGGYFADLRRLGAVPAKRGSLVPLAERSGGEVNLFFPKPRPSLQFDDRTKTHRGFEYLNDVWP